MRVQFSVNLDFCYTVPLSRKLNPIFSINLNSNYLTCIVHRVSRKWPILTHQNTSKNQCINLILLFCPGKIWFFLWPARWSRSEFFSDYGQDWIFYSARIWNHCSNAAWNMICFFPISIVIRILGEINFISGSGSKILIFYMKYAVKIPI